MALRRANITRASLITLPTHIAVSGGLATCWLIQPGVGTSASLTALENFWPLNNTAFVLLVVSVALAFSWLVLRSRTAVAICLAAAAFIYAGLVWVAGLNHLPGSSYGSTFIFGGLAAYHLASLVSIVFYDQPGTGSA